MSGLDLGTVWEVDGKGIDSEEFLLSLPHQFPEATTLFAEGCSIAADVEAVLRRYEEPGDFLPGANTIWPESTKLRCQFSSPAAEALAQLARNHAAPELFDHFFLFDGPKFLLYWHDAFMGPMWLAPTLSEAVVATFAARFHRSYRYVSEGT